eukprot:XP_015580683.1 uncharacterized protein LOC8288714 [Ricinus communis]
MGTKEETKLKTELQGIVLQTFTQFSTRIAKNEELGAVGSRLLSGFQQELEVNACLLGLQDHLTKAKSILNELENLLEDLASAINSSKESFSPLKDKDLCEEFDQQAII